MQTVHILHPIFQRFSHYKDFAHLFVIIADCIHKVLGRCPKRFSNDRQDNK